MVCLSIKFFRVTHTHTKPCKSIKDAHHNIKTIELWGSSKPINMNHNSTNNCPMIDSYNHDDFELTHTFVYGSYSVNCFL